MTQINQGTVTINISDDITIPARAGTLSPEEVLRIPKARRGIGLACESTADAMIKNPERICPHNVDVATLAEKGRVAEAIDNVIVDTEAALIKLKQANLLLDAEAHEALRKVLSFVRSQEKFDPRLVDLVPALITYFAQDHDKNED